LRLGFPPLPLRPPPVPMDKFMTRAVPGGHKKRKAEDGSASAPKKAAAAAAAAEEEQKGAAAAGEFDDSLDDAAMCAAVDAASASNVGGGGGGAGGGAAAAAAEGGDKPMWTAAAASSAAQREAWGAELKEKFLVPFPPCFFELWDLARELKPGAPAAAFHALGVALVGPFDVLAGRWADGKASDGAPIAPEQWLAHWRYFYDPPELLTVLTTDRVGRGGSDGLHWGYFRDDPEDLPSCVASNTPRRLGEDDAASAPPPCAFAPCGSNLFAALNARIELMRDSPGVDAKALARVERALLRRAERAALPLDVRGGGPLWRARKSTEVAKVFSGLGMVVPFDKKSDVGYRPLPHTDKELKKMWSRLQDANPKRRDTQGIDELVTWCTIANDECDFGMALQCGQNLLSWERQEGPGAGILGAYVEQLLPITYMLLDRTPFSEILEAHLANRRRPKRAAIE